MHVYGDLHPWSAQAKELGVTLTADWNEVKAKRVKMPFVAALTDGAMPYMIDRPSDSMLPTLKESMQCVVRFF